MVTSLGNGRDQQAFPKEEGWSCEVSVISIDDPCASVTVGELRPYMVIEFVNVNCIPDVKWLV
jgi:hypothetical protein